MSSSCPLPWPPPAAWLSSSCPPPWPPCLSCRFLPWFSCRVLLCLSLPEMLYLWWPDLLFFCHLEPCRLSFATVRQPRNSFGSALFRELSPPYARCLPLICPVTVRQFSSRLIRFRELSPPCVRYLPLTCPVTVFPTSYSCFLFFQGANLQLITGFLPDLFRTFAVG